MMPAPVTIFTHIPDNKTKWSDNTFDDCPWCGGHTGCWPTTYEFAAMELFSCPHCGGRLINAYEAGRGFFWKSRKFRVEFLGE